MYDGCFNLTRAHAATSTPALARCVPTRGAPQFACVGGPFRAPRGRGTAGIAGGVAPKRGADFARAL